MAPQVVSGHQGGIITVAITAQLSFLATLLLIGILLYYRLRLWNPKSRSVIGSEEFCLKFLRSQFAILFIDLLASDLIQSLGFLLNLAHVGKPIIEDSTICTVQGVFIQLGDTSGAFATVAIAVHTFIVLINRTPPSTAALLIVLGIKWALVFILAMIGPLAFATDALGPFYGPAGAWCWISSAYPWQRLCLHYVWLFFAGAASAVTYALIFWNVRRRLRTQYAQTSYDRSVEETSMENAAKKMLVYPLCYLLLMLPLGIDRITSIFGRTWSLDVQIACGVIFTLVGLVDSVVFCWTRNIFAIRARSTNPVTESSHGDNSKGTLPDASDPQNRQPFISPQPGLELKSPNILIAKPAEKSLSSRINGNVIQFMPAKYSLATIDMNSFDDPEPSNPPPSDTSVSNRKF
ncbi:hypothetical protein PtA15_5A140 [Puccinia triticina]|uniref:Glucose receptor Git3-like N-terminal domain-containing protein n=1 Tax=Puccinia triticina TaxID=208348 RepID=A0ABY7CIJ5_9BASI|nr:uncharacterized protein PtA15_5A140 [Puccinia triticina]WAQ84570.1 hypothetical protein PtA15_5A140 [Puccinia triticina]WAR57914.1 hypothetical protein PtB15_5B144 [Puccinia triticina]